VKKSLEPFLPIPRLRRAGKKWAFDYKRPKSIGRVRAFYGNFGVLVRALAYILAHGGAGLRNATVDAVLNANYIRKGLEPYFDLPYKAANMHEVVFSDDRQAKQGVHTGDVAKRLIDYGFHPYTVSFPLIVHGALMIEPTETESKQEIDQFIEAMISIAGEVEGPVLVVHGACDALVEQRECPPHDRDVDREIRAIEDEDLGVEHRHALGTVHTGRCEVNESQADSPVFSGSAGRHRSTGRRAARVSSSRATRVLWGASRTVAGSVRASSAMRSIAFANSSSVSRVSVSVGSIMSAPLTTSGK